VVRLRFNTHDIPAKQADTFVQIRHSGFLANLPDPLNRIPGISKPYHPGSLLETRRQCDVVNLTMNPSSPTETESSLRITVEPHGTALPPDQRVMTPRELEQHQIVGETQQPVRTEPMEEPSIINVILAFITFGLVFGQKTVWISRRPSSAQGWAQPFVFIHRFFYPAVEALWSFCVFFVLVSLAILGCSIGRLDGLAKWVADLR
jgi:hypothetical protein